MKKKSLFLCIMLLCGCLSGFAQSSVLTKEAKEFIDKYKAISAGIADAMKENNYAQVVQSYWTMLKTHDALPANVQKEIGLEKGGIYYNIACYESVQNHKKAALNAFEKAYQNKYINYPHIVKDTDLDNIRNEKKFREILSKIKEEGDFAYMLQTSAEYSTNMQTDTLPRFTYMNPNDSNLVHVREHFKLDSVAGAGDEISKIKNILAYIHNKILHDGQHPNPKEATSIALAEACKDGSRGLNCRGLATVLNECYLAMGFKSRFVTCMPKTFIGDCHVINTVYSNTLDKWLWVDPTQNSWVTDEKGEMLSIQEVRERIRKGLPYRLNEEANWNNRKKTTTEEHLGQYMAKNLYYISCMLRSEFGAENKKFNPADYVALMPTGYFNDMEKGSYIVNDDAWFWQSPY